MGTTADKLNKIITTKEAIRTAINNKGGTLTTSDKFSDYATAIDNIQSGGGDTSNTKYYKNVSKGGTAIPNDGTPISKIYLNIKLPNVAEYIKSLGLTFYESNGFKFYPFLFDTNTYNAYLILEDGNIQTMNFTNTAQQEYWLNNGHWESNIVNKNGIIEFSSPITTLSEFNGFPIGLENEKIKSIISFDNSIGVENKKCSNEDILSGNVIEIESDIKRIRYGAFAKYVHLKKVNLPNVNIIEEYAFNACEALQNISLPLVETIYNGAFFVAKYLESAYLPKIKRLGGGGDAFYFCDSLKVVIIEQTETICKLHSSDSFLHCSHFTGKVDTQYNPNGDKDGFVYVPDSLVEQYKVAEYWSNIASQIKPLSELPQKYKDLYNIA